MQQIMQIFTHPRYSIQFMEGIAKREGNSTDHTTSNNGQEAINADQFFIGKRLPVEFHELVLFVVRKLIPFFE